MTHHGDSQTAHLRKDAGMPQCTAERLWVRLYTAHGPDMLAQAAPPRNCRHAGKAAQGCRCFSEELTEQEGISGMEEIGDVPAAPPMSPPAV